MRRYLEIWRLPGAKLLIVCGFLGRLPMAMLPLALIQVVHARTDSWTAAGTAVSVYTVTVALVAPVFGRLVDRKGPRRVLLVLGVAHPAAIVVLLLLLRGPVPLGAVYLGAAAVGATFPVLSSTIRALWNQIADGDAALRSAAFALDSTGMEVVWVTGPMLVGFAIAVASAATALGLGAAVCLMGTVSVAVSDAARGWRPHPRRERSALGPLRARGMGTVLCGVSALLFCFGVVEVAIPAHADGLGGRALAGVLLASWSAGSGVSGVIFGTLRLRRPLVAQWRWALLGVVVTSAPLMLGAGLWIAPLLFLFGTSAAPTIIVQNGLVAEIAPPGTTTEAFTWMNMVAYGSSALGAALGGVVLEQPAGVRGAFAVATAGAALGLGCAVVGTRGVERRRAMLAEGTA